MTMRRLALETVALLLLLAPPSSAAEKVTMFDRFELWNDCRPVGLLVEALPEHAGKIGLSEEAIQTTVRSRLRAARLYSESLSETALSRLYVNVNVLRSAFSISFEYSKEVLDRATKLNLRAITWKLATLGTLGTHRRDPNYILSSLALEVDEFIDEYLRVNRDSCEKRSPAR